MAIYSIYNFNNINIRHYVYYIIVMLCVYMDLMLVYI